MFKTALIAVLSLILTTSYSQINETTPAPKNYLGELNGKHIYCTGLSHIRTNEITLYQIEDGEVIQTEVIRLPHDRFEQAFLFENTLYGIVSDSEEQNFSLIKFDKGFAEKQRTEIMFYQDKPRSFDQKVLSKPVEQTTKVIYHSGKVLFYVSFNYVRIAIIDLKSMKSTSYDLDVVGSNSFEASDALFFNETDAHVVFEYRFDSPLPKEYYATFVNGKSNTFRLNDYEEKASSNVNASSFKFIRANDKDFLVSTAYQKGLNGKYVGFTVTEIKHANITELNMNVIINDKLDNPDLWSKKNYKKWKRNGAGNLYRNPKLDQAQYIDGQLVLCTRYAPEESTFSNIMVTSINTDRPTGPEINWNAVTHNGIFNRSGYWYNQYSHAYILAEYPDHLRLFYNCKGSTINENGVVTKSKKEANPVVIMKGIETEIAIMDINLNDGSSRFIQNPYRNDPSYPKRVDSPFYYVLDNNIHFILELTNYPKTLKERTTYTPKAIVFPIN